MRRRFRKKQKVPLLISGSVAVLEVESATRRQVLRVLKELIASLLLFMTQTSWLSPIPTTGGHFTVFLQYFMIAEAFIMLSKAHYNANLK